MSRPSGSGSTEEAVATVTEEGVAPVVATGTVEAVAKSKRRIEARWRAAGAFAANLEGLVEGFRLRGRTYILLHISRGLKAILSAWGAL